jgi:hypothetical protein
VPSGWPSVRVASGAVLVYPPGWRLIHGDAGTATAALRTESGRFLGYLNLTPRQGDEQLATWPAFRLEHNAEEGQRDLNRIAAATGLRFATGRGSCVEDSYVTRARTSYIEIACLVSGSRTSSVVVGAAPPGLWPRMSGAIEQAVAAVRS